MKRLIKISFMLFVSALLYLPEAAFSDIKAGNVVTVRGNVVVERVTGEIPAKIKLDLLEQDSVVTEKKSRVKMLFRDDSILTLGQSSRLIVKQYLYNPEEKRADSIYELLDGKLRAVVGNAGLKVVTPTAYAAARGTIFIVWYDPVKKVTGIAVVEGEVEIGSITEGAGDVKILTKGQMTLVYSGHVPKEPEGFTLEPHRGGLLLGDMNVDFLFDDFPRLTLPERGFGSFASSDVQWFRLTSTPPINQQPAGNTTPVNINLVFQ